MHRFFSENANFQYPQIVLNTPTEIHHLKTVLRLKAGAKVQIFSANGQEALCEIISLSAEEARLKVLDVKTAAQRNMRIILACALPKKAKFEFILEKCTELGVDEIIPLQTQRTEVEITKEKGPRKTERFKTVVINAAKQSKRLSIPHVHEPMTFKQALQSAQNAQLKLFPWLEGERQAIAQAIQAHPEAKSIFVMIGPEGDFTKDEAKLALADGFIPVTLGATVLKVDTAAIAVTAYINFLYNN